MHHGTITDDGVECIEGGNWSSDCSNSEDEDAQISPAIPVRQIMQTNLLSN